jgi:hypothetical protein
MAPSSVTWPSSWHLARRHRSWRRARKYPRTPILSVRFFSVHFTSPTAKYHCRRSLLRPHRPFASPPARLAAGRPPRSLPARRSPPPPGVRPEIPAAARSSPPPPPVVRPRRPELAAPARSSSRRPELRQRSATARYGWPPPGIFF